MPILGLFSSGDGWEKIWGKLLNWIAVEEKQKKARIKCSHPLQLEQLDKLYMLFSFPQHGQLEAEYKKNCMSSGN